jgi:hypothetical protein
VANIYGYFGMENLAMTNPQRNTLATELGLLGQEDNGACHRRIRSRVRLDNQAIIFRAVFDDAVLTPTALRNRLATIFGVAANTITPTVSLVNLAGFNTQVITFNRAGTDYLRCVLFGKPNGGWPTIAQSRAAVHGYLAANAAQWETTL